MKRPVAALALRVALHLPLAMLSTVPLPILAQRVSGPDATQTLRRCVVADKENAHASECLTNDELQRYLDELPTTLRSQPAVRRVEIQLLSGIYDWAAPLRVDSQTTDGGRIELSFAGDPQGGTVLRGSRSRPLQSLPQAAPPSDAYRFDHFVAAPHLQVSLPGWRRAWLFGVAPAADAEVFLAGQRLPRTRWPQSGFGSIMQVSSEQQRLRLAVAAQDARPLAGQHHLRVGGYFMHDWAHEIFEVDHVGLAGEITLRRQLPGYGARPGARVWLDNLDVPNAAGPSWCSQPDLGRILIHGVNAAHVEVATITTAFVLDGAQRVALRDLTLQEFLGDAVRGEHTQQLTLERLVVRNVGGSGISLHGTDLRIADSQLDGIGATGIAVQGGDRRSLAASRIDVVGNLILRTGRHIRTYAPAIAITGVGIRVLGNTLQDGPHAAIVYHGNDHLIQNNRIERFVTEADDAGAIYTGADWSERGTVIDGNVIMKVGRTGLRFGANAIYFDDQASGQTVTRNVLIDVDRGIIVGGGSDNLVEDNTIDATSHALLVDARGWSADAAERQRLLRPFFEKLRAVDGQSSTYLARYPRFALLNTSTAGRPDGIAFTGNRIASHSRLEVHQAARAGTRLERNSTFRVDASVRAQLIDQAIQQWQSRRQQSSLPGDPASVGGALR